MPKTIVGIFFLVLFSISAAHTVYGVFLVDKHHML